MSNGYNFYIKPEGGNDIDIEKAYNCVYKQFSNFSNDGEIKNVYTEDYAEQNGSRVWVPSQPDLTHKAYDCKLQLLFLGRRCAENAKAFHRAFGGVRCEYHDTFRNQYASLLMTKQPSVVQAGLYKENPYQLVEFTFSNIGGILTDSAGGGGDTTIEPITLTLSTNGNDIFVDL